MDARVYAAVVLAGGAGRRLGGPAKPTLAVAGRPMLTGVLAAVAAAEIRVVVGPPDLAPVLPPGVLLAQEQPPGGGPAAALVAGLAAVAPASAADPVVAVLAADLPLLTTNAVGRLVVALRARGPRTDGAVYVDGSGRPQWLCGTWRMPALRARCAELARAGPVAGRSLRELVAPLRVVEVTAGEDPPPWYDCDTPDQVRAAEAMAPRPDPGPDNDMGGRP